MTLPITSIESFCEAGISPNAGGLRSIKIADVADVDGDTIASGATVYLIHFAPGTGQYSDADNAGAQGIYTDQTVTAFVAGKRASMEMLRRRLRDRRVAVECLDTNGETHLIAEGLITINYTTGAQRSDSNGYDITIKGKTLLRGVRHTPSIFSSISGSEGSTQGSDFSTDQTPIGDTVGPSDTSYYMQVVTSMLDYVPSTTGNAQEIRNRFVTASDGSRWAIDYQGRGTLLYAARFRQEEYITTPTTEVTLTPPASTALDPHWLIVSRNGVILEYDHPDVSGYGLDIPNEKLLSPAVWPFQDDRLQIFYL